MIKDFQPRLYQQTILGTTSHFNTLVVLPTGLGKTAAAFMLAAQRLHQYPNSKILMLSPTKPLCEQHVDTFQRHLEVPNEEVVLFTGSVKPEKRAELWKAAKVIISTPQGLENDLINKRVKFEDVSLLIVDEAHRATGDYAYVWIAEQYDKISRYARILSLTASPGSDMEAIQEVCQNLKVEKVEVRTENDPDVKPYMQEVTFNWVKVEFPESYKKVQKFLQDCRASKLLEAQRYGYCKGTSLTKTELLRLQGQLQRDISQGMREFEMLRSVSLIAEALKVDHALELLESQGIAQLHSYLDGIKQQALTSKVKAVKNLAIDLNFKSAAHVTEQLLDTVHPKVVKLQEIVQAAVERNASTKLIIFTQYRDSGAEIVKKLDEINVSNHIFVGQAKKKGVGFSQKEQKEILDKFRNGEFNVLVATSLHPDEYIVIQDPKKRIHIVKIGEFVNERRNKSLKGWNTIVGDENEIGYYPITNLIKHKRQSNVVKVTLASGFECLVTEDHSLFTFNEHSQLVSSKPEVNLFVNFLTHIPPVQKIEEIDIIKELLKKVPEKDREKFFCQVKGLSQPKIREINSERKVLAILIEKDCNKITLAHKTKLNLTTITSVTKRLHRNGMITEQRYGKGIMCSILNKGKQYCETLLWLNKNMYYHKKKYRIKLVGMTNAPEYIDLFFKIEVGVFYGKKTLPLKLSLNEHLARFLGLYVAEGAARLTSRTSNVYLAARKKEMQDYMINSIAGGIGLPTKRSWRGVSIHAQIAYYLIKYIFPCGVGSHNKEIPNLIFSADREIQLAFLEGYFRGDGHYDKDRNRIVLTTVSRKLAVGLVFLLRQLGILKLTIQKQHAYRICIYESLPFAPLKETISTKNYYSLAPRSLVEKEFFAVAQNKYFKGKRDRKSSRIIQENAGKTCYDYIKKIEILKEQPEYVYDISVAKKERFIGGIGLVQLHNSVAEEGLDIPKVDDVIFYEPIPSAIRSIQRRGRTGRLEKGEVTVLLTKGTRDEAYRWSAHHKEKRMYRNLEKLRNGFTLQEQKQDQTLHKFIKDDKVVAVLADHREKDNKVVKELIDVGVSVQTGQLEMADYLVSGRVAVELKKVPDFVASIIDGRLLEQVRGLKKNFEKAVVIIEGEEDIYSVRKVHANAIRGMLASIVLDFGVPVLYTKNPRDTAGLLAVMAKREQDKGRDFSYHASKPRSMKEQQEFIVSSFPSIGVNTARILLQHFGSVKEVVNASKEEMMKLEGIGSKTADGIIGMVEGKYSKG